jgi:GNAT superfamily N-acetyltransferase
MNEPNITIRPARQPDIPALALLMTELGYATTEADMQQRFALLQSNANYATWLAVCDTTIAGMIGLLKNIYFEKNGIYVRIGALVVHAAYRNKGIGKLLIGKAEAWAAELGAREILVNSGNRAERKVAHAFYQQLGFEPKTTGFVKVMP